MVPGNHDWDKSGDRGLARVLEQAAFVQAHTVAAGRVSFHPGAGCPGPSYMDLGRGVRLVFYDSEWLLRRNKPKTTTNCTWGNVDRLASHGPAAITNADFAERLRQVMVPYRTVILASHHPIRTEGAHGGRHPWWHYALIGYPFLRHGVVRSSQDISSGENRAMREIVVEAMSVEHVHPIIHASGHEHGLQIFDAMPAAKPAAERGPADAVYLVSGSGSKAGALGKAADTLFKHGALGFMTLDLLTDNRILLRVVEPGATRPAFFHWIRE